MRVIRRVSLVLITLIVLALAWRLWPASEIEGEPR